MSKTEKDWHCIAEDRHHADTSDVDDDKSDIDNEEDWPVDEDNVCDDESHVDDIWPYTDGNLW